MSAVKFRAKFQACHKWSYKTGLFEPFKPSMRGLIRKETISQYTGENDSNDAEMYGGDIVKFTVWWFDGNEAETTLTGVLVYDDKSLSWALKGVKNGEWGKHTGCSGQDHLTPFSELCFDEADFTVIGNIHDNPELMEATK